MTVPRNFVFPLLFVVLGFGLAPARAAEPAATPISWHTDYSRAVDAATEQGKYLLIFFHEEGANPVRDAFESKSLAHPSVQKPLVNFECAKLPLDSAIYINGKLTRLLSHPAFAEMLGSQGFAILDYAHPGTPLFGTVVNVFPFAPGRYKSPEALKTALTLPPGTLTQRTMIYAVRMHPERPASTHGQFNPVLASEAESHSHYQARIRVQGHHRWDFRFARILGRLFFGGPGPVEVVAESWPGKTLVDAAVDCVDSWRHSPGHWQQVRDNHGAYAYDMKRGSNGIWYATGIFAGYQKP